jgi:2-aminoadipate transaminase
MDATYLQRFLSDSARGATRSEIRELLKVIARPDIISLAGGLPATETFPAEELAELIPVVLREHGPAAMQYGPTEGDLELRREIIALMIGLEGDAFRTLTPDQVLITSGSQQALDLCSRIFIGTYDSVVVGLPSYLGALGAFTASGAKLSGVPLDENGMRTDLLEQRLVDLRREGIHPKLIYVVPDFGNPSGVTMSLERRDELLCIAREFDLMVLEDSPYRQLRYVGQALPTLNSLDRDGRVVTMFTFSKILFPGLRLGWVVADPQVISHLVVAKQPVDCCTAGLSQVLTREYMKTGRLPKQIERTRAIYAGKLRVMIEALEESIDADWGVRWAQPEGGLFLWVELPEWMNARTLLDRVLDEEKVAFVVGDAFHCDRSGANTLRLNFSYPSEDQLRTAARGLGSCIGRMVAEHVPAAGQELPVVATTDPELLVDGEHSLDQLSWNMALSEIVE